MATKENEVLRERGGLTWLGGSESLSEEGRLKLARWRGGRRICHSPGWCKGLVIQEVTVSQCGWGSKYKGDTIVSMAWWSWHCFPDLCWKSWQILQLLTLLQNPHLAPEHYWNVTAMVSKIAVGLISVTLKIGCFLCSSRGWKIPWPY